MEHSILEWIQGTFEGVNCPSIETLYSGDVQSLILHQIEPNFWSSPVRASDPRSLPSRSDKHRNLITLTQSAEAYFQCRSEPNVLPMNFKTTLIDQLLDMNSQRALLVTIDLILIVMLNS